MIQTTTNAADEGARLDFFAAKAAGITRSFCQRLIEQGYVTVNGTAQKANRRLNAGEAVQIILPEPQPDKVCPENLPLDIIYEDEHIIVINKARGMTVHPAAGSSSGTLVNALLYHCADLSGINGTLRPGIVHRLDKDTSGVMVAAKTDTAHLNLSEQLKSKAMHRAYWAIVHGIIGENDGTIKGRIGRHPTERKMMAISPTGKEAVTHFHVLERFTAGYTLIECRLETGRTHQIRVHLTHIGHPLVGDPKYGRRKSPFNIAGQALHSHELTLLHPITGEKMTFNAPMPPDMAEILDSL